MLERREEMLGTHGAGLDPGATKVVILLAIIAVIFWRQILRIAIAILAAAMLMLVGMGAYTLLHL
jgi:hypothetical protein